MLLAGRRSSAESNGRTGAPIGAQVFGIERRNHSKTGVYAIPCMRVLVDTPPSADKLKRAKKGFKFERFEGYFHIRRIRSARPESSDGKDGRQDRNDSDGERGGHVGARSREGSAEKSESSGVGRPGAGWSGLGREATKMNGHPVESLRTTRGQRSEENVLPTFPGSAPRSRDAFAVPLACARELPSIPERREIIHLFKPATGPVSACPDFSPSPQQAVRTRLGNRAARMSVESRETTRATRTLHASRQNAAQPLQLNRVRVEMTARLRKKLQGEATRRWRNERT